MSISAARRRVLDAVAAGIPRPSGGGCARVGIDGPDGAGKTTFADELADVVRHLDRPVIRVSVDDFHHVQAVRYGRGRDSPVGFWLDSFDYDRFIGDVLRPVGPGGTRMYRRAAHDLRTDTIIDGPWLTPPVGGVLIVDGIFLHRDELTAFWDYSVFLDVPFAVTAERMARRDGTHSDPAHPSMRRYVRGQQLYFEACDPQSRAAIVIDNTVPQQPFILASKAAVGPSQVEGRFSTDTRTGSAIDKRITRE